MVPQAPAGHKPPTLRPARAPSTGRAEDTSGFVGPRFAEGVDPFAAAGLRVFSGAAMRQSEPPTFFLPVASGSPGRRGLDRARTTRLLELRRRYEAMRDAPDASPETNRYAASVLLEIRDELRRRTPEAA